MWHLSSPARDHTPAVEVQSLNHWTVREVPEILSVRRVYAPPFLSRHNEDLEWSILKPSRLVTALRSWTECVIALRSWTECVIALRQISITASVTALFYLEESRKIHLSGVRACRSKDTRKRAPQRVGERVSQLALALLFICLSLPGPVLCKLGQPGVLFLLPEVLTPVLRPFVSFS